MPLATLPMAIHLASQQISAGPAWSAASDRRCLISDVVDANVLAVDALRQNCLGSYADIQRAVEKWW